MARIRLIDACLGSGARAGVIGNAVRSAGDQITANELEKGMSYDTDIQAVIINPGPGEEWIPIGAVSKITPDTSKRPEKS